VDFLHATLRGADLATRLVIQRNTIDYLAPITGDFEAVCSALPSAEVERFIRTVRRHGKARITVAAELTCAGLKTASFSGDYVAVRLDGTSGPLAQWMVWCSSAVIPGSR